MVYHEIRGSVEKTAAFYMQAFDMQEASRSPNGSLHLTDGYIDLAILHWKLTITHIACHRLSKRLATRQPSTSNVKSRKPRHKVRTPGIPSL